MLDFIAPEPIEKSIWAKNSYRYKAFVKQRGLCCYCEKEMTYPLYSEDATKDKSVATREHLKRKIESGGRYDETVHGSANVAIAHSSCNARRSDLPWIVWKSVCMGEMTHLEAVKFCDEIGIEVPLFKQENQKYKRELENENL